MTVRNQQALYELIDEKLNGNSYDVNFKVDLFNAGTTKYFTKDDKGQKHRFVPVMVTDVIGEYLNIPNANSTSNSVGISFDVYVDKQGEISDKEVTEFENVGYNNTLNAIEEFKNSLLAKYFPLGTPYLYMGGEDSTGTFDFTTPTGNIDKYILEILPKDTTTENIVVIDDALTIGISFTKDASNITFNYNGNSMSVPYTVETLKTITVIRGDAGVWTIEDELGNTDTFTDAFTTFLNGLSFGDTTGLSAMLKSFKMYTNEYDTLALIDLSDFQSKDEFTNNGEKTDITTNEINNSILWGSNGSAIFGFNTLNPVSNIEPRDGQYYYQEFELEMKAFISNDVLFGNNFEYYLSFDGANYEQIFPIDRNHTLGTQLGSNQKINANTNEHIIEESSREHTLSFYYIPTTKLNKLLKHVVDPSIAQNTGYSLKVQYPFFNVTYDVVIENGGLEPNINTISTFTLTLKRKATFV